MAFRDLLARDVILLTDRHPESKGEYDQDSNVKAYAFASSHGFFDRVERGFVREILKKLGSMEDANVLDVGTGPGWIPISLAKAKPSWTFTALDQSELMLKQAAREAAHQGVQVRWVRASAETTNLPPNSFDLVISHFALHEFDDPSAVLNEIKRVCKPGGRIMIQDFERPSRLLMPFVRLLLRLYYAYSKSMRQQALDSIAAAYSVPELKRIFEESQLVHRVVPRWIAGTKVVQIEAVNSSGM